jgi:hypothetical protein
VFTAGLAISLGVIYHLTEDAVFEAYLTHLFAAAAKYVIIYATDGGGCGTAPHVRLVEAVAAFGQPDVRLSVFGAGNHRPACCVRSPGPLVRAAARPQRWRSWSRTVPADLFVLATQVRKGHGSVCDGLGLVLLKDPARPAGWASMPPCGPGRRSPPGPTAAKYVIIYACWAPAPAARISLPASEHGVQFITLSIWVLSICD